jgi:Resolvase, N terminal domain
VSTVKQDLDRQIDALEQVRIPRDRIYVDRKSGATTDRPGLRAITAYARASDGIVVHTLDRLGRTVRDTLNLIHELAERKIGVRNLADPIKVDSSNPEDPMAQLAVVLLALFGQMERTRWNVPRTRGRSRPRRAVVSAGRCWSTQGNWNGQLICARRGARSLRSSSRPASRAPACTAISRRALNRRSLQTEVRRSIETLSRELASHGPR